MLNLNYNLCTKLVHDMAKLMEVGLHLIVLQQGGSISCRFAEVGHHGCHRHLSCAIMQQTTRLQAKASCMPILPLSEGGKKEGTTGYSFQLSSHESIMARNNRINSVAVIQ